MRSNITYQAFMEGSDALKKDVETIKKAVGTLTGLVNAFADQVARRCNESPTEFEAADFAVAEVDGEMRRYGVIFWLGRDAHQKWEVTSTLALWYGTNGSYSASIPWSDLRWGIVNPTVPLKGMRAMARGVNTLFGHVWIQFPEVRLVMDDLVHYKSDE